MNHYYVDENNVYHESPGYGALWESFGISRATWLALPRALMHEMPDDWQLQMAELVKKWDEYWSFPNDIGGTAVLMKDENGKFSKWPDWLIDYRHPDYEKIESIKKTKED